MQTHKVQVLGLTRWSYPFHGKGFRRPQDDLERLREELYAPQRLDHRLFLLEHVLLPGLRAQKDLDFTHLFLIGDQLPEPWRSRVLELLKTIPQVIPVVREEGGRHQDLCREIVLEHVDQTSDATAQYRLDDDDGVGVEFVGQTRQLFLDMKPIFDRCGRMALDFTRGFLLKSTQQDISMLPVSMRFWAPGMAIFQRPDSNRIALDFNHLKIWHHMPTLTWQDEPMFIRGAHHDNDSDLASFGRRTRGFKFKQTNPQRHFQKRFGIDLATIEQIWDSNKDHFLADMSDETDSYRASIVTA